MNILIISTNQNALPLPVMPMGACMVAEAAERSGHTVSLVDLMFEKRPLAAIHAAVVSARPDVIGMSVRNIDNNDMLDTAFFLSDLRLIMNAIRRETDAPVVLGGAALSVMPEDILRMGAVPCGIVGDGEVSFPSLLDRMARNAPIADVPGVVYFNHAIFQRAPSLAAYHAPASVAPNYHKWLNLPAYRMRMASAPIRTKTGCPFQCVYCTYPKIEGNTWRLSECGHIVDAVARLTASGLREIEFVDSVFNEPYGHALAVCDGIARTGLHTRLQSLDLTPRSIDHALLTAMEGAGFVGMGITVESASDEVLAGLRKGFTARDVHQTAETVRKHRLPCLWIFLLGGPSETMATVQQTLRFAGRAIRPSDTVFFNVGIRIYPGTELENIARKQGVLTTPRDKMLNPVFYVSPEVDADWIQREVKKSMNSHMNFLSAGSIAGPFLPKLHVIGYHLGLKEPLWKYTRFIRRGLRFFGMDR